MRGIARRGAPRRTRHLACREECAGCARPAGRRGGVLPRMRRSGTVRADHPRVPIRATGARRLHRHRAHARRRLHDPARTARGLYPPRRSQWSRARASRRAPDRNHVRRRDSGYRRLRSRARTAIAARRHRARGFRGRVHRRRHLPARQHGLPHLARRARQGARRGCARRAADDSVLDRRSAGAHG